MAARKSAESDVKDEGVLITAARTVGHAAGEAARSLGMGGVASEHVKPRKSAKPSKPVSGRAKRAEEAAALKEAAASLDKAAASADVRYRRIMGKRPSIWSQKDIDYIDQLVSAKHAAP